MSRRYESSRLVQRARQVGRLAGQAVVVVHQVQEFIQDMRRRREQEQGNEFSAQVLARTRKLGEEAAEAAELGRRVRNTALRTLRRGRRAVHEHPAQVVLAAGIAGLVVGAALRLGRSHRAQ